jgi:hypothetical protein
MRETFSHRDARVCALLVFSAGFLISNCAENLAFADDESVKTLSTPPPPHHFGDRGDLVIPMLTAGFGTAGDPEYSAAGFGIDHFSYVSQVGGPRQTGTTYSFTPNADIFIGKHVSIGAALHVNYYVDTFADQSSPDDRQLALGFSPRVGYAFPVSDHVSIWPRVSFGMNAYDAIDSGPLDVLVPFELVAKLDVQFVYSIDRSFYVAVAPSLTLTGFPENGEYASEFEAALGSSFNAGFVL